MKSWLRCTKLDSILYKCNKANTRVAWKHTLYNAISHKQKCLLLKNLWNLIIDIIHLWAKRMSSFVISDNSDLLRHTNVSKAYNEHKNESDHRKVGQSAMPAYTYIQLIVVLSVRLCDQVIILQGELFLQKLKQWVLCSMLVLKGPSWVRSLLLIDNFFHILFLGVKASYPSWRGWGWKCYARFVKACRSG